MYQVFVIQMSQEEGPVGVLITVPPLKLPSLPCSLPLFSFPPAFSPLPRSVAPSLPRSIPPPLASSLSSLPRSSSYRVCDDAHPSHSSTLHFCDVVFARYLPEMYEARHAMVQIACGCAAHTVFVITVTPQIFRCRGGSLSRAHSVGRPPCTPRQCVTTRELFFSIDVIFLQVALGSLPVMLPLRDTSFCGLTQERI